MHQINSKSIKDSDPLEGETEDSPSTINLNDGDLRIMLEDNPKSSIQAKQPRKAKSEVQQVEENIDKIKALSRKSRVKGELSNYFTCHGCNGFMERKYFLVCSIKDCKRYFCFRCANKKFHSTSEEIASLIHEDNWLCYSCSNMCNCRICKKIYMGKEETFPHQLTKFERAKKRTGSKNEEKDEISDDSEAKSNDSGESDHKPEIRRPGRAKSENKAQAVKAEEKKMNKKQEDKENKQDSSKDNKKNKVPEPKEKNRETGKDKSGFVVQKEVEDVTKEIKRMISNRESSKQIHKIEKKIPTKKITSLITRNDKSGRHATKLKKKVSKSDESEDSSDPEYVVESLRSDRPNEEDKKPSTKESALSRHNSEKETPKPSKNDTSKADKSKEEEKPEEKKFKPPKIKRELKQLLKMNDEMNDFNKLISEESFEMSNSLPFEENSRAFSQIEPRKVVRRFRAKPDEVCHICKNIFEKEHMYPCTVPGCDKSFCSFCIQSNFIQDFDPRAFKAEQFICYVCGKFCKCKECDKSSYHANKRRARRNEMRMGTSRRGRRMRGRRVIETRRRKFYDTLPDDYVPGNALNETSNTIDRSFNYEDDRHDYSYERDLEDEVDDDASESENSELSDAETKHKFMMRKKRLRNGAIPKAKNNESKRDVDIETKDENKTNRH